MAGTWTQLTNSASFNASTMLLLTDGTVMCSDEGVAAAGTNHWWKLTPDSTGGYVNGTWSPLADSPTSPLFYSSAVLRDGRVFVAGGEYNGSSTTADLLAAQVYDPVADAWTVLTTPPTWTNIGDAPGCVLPDGAVLIGSIIDDRTAIYHPDTNTWTEGGHKRNQSSSEETWTLLPDGTVLSVDCIGHPNAQKYVIRDKKWVSAGKTPVDLVEASSIEIGPALLLPDGHVFAIGATGATALYKMPHDPEVAGTWHHGPTLPVKGGQQLIAKDAPGCLLPNGRVLFAVSPAGGCAPSNQGYCPPTYFFEFDSATHALAAVPNPGPGGVINKAVFNCRLLVLPNGQVLFSYGNNDLWVYIPDGTPHHHWRSHVHEFPAQAQQNNSYRLYGTQLNGLSQANSYGDDAQMATNYPLVRIRNLASNNVTYCRTLDHSTMAVATGQTHHSTLVQVPPTIETGPSELEVVANGISSLPRPVTIDT